MDKFEQRMQQASQELRESTKSLTPPVTEPKPVRNQPRWVAFAVGFAAVALAIGILPGLIGDPGEVAAVPDTTVPDVTEPTDPVTSTTLDQEPGAVCSSGGIAAPGPIEGLPEEVSEMREALIAAALACDFDALEALGPNLSTNLGASGVEQFRIWEARGDGQMGNLVLLLGMTHVVQDFPDAPVDFPIHYAWPAAFGYESWDDIPQSLLDELLAIYTEEDLELISGFGSYAGWRTTITDTGEWRFYTAGD